MSSLDKKTVTYIFLLFSQIGFKNEFLSIIVQQCFVNRQMIQDLHIPTKMHICPTVREQDGLAMSSRNTYLSESQRQYALVLSQALTKMEQLYRAGTLDASTLSGTGIQLIEEACQRANASEDWEMKLDYVSINSGKDLSPVIGEIDTSHGCVISLAVFVGKTRLIDNICLDIN
jgi:pantoate--beta-alanine ligase